MISPKKLKILTPLQKLPKNVGDLGKLIVATGYEKLPKVHKSPNLVTLGSVLPSSYVSSVVLTAKLPRSKETTRHKQLYF